MRLAPDALLRRAEDITFWLDSSNLLHIELPEGSVECGPHSLAILQAFAAPRRLDEALALLRPRLAGLQDWIGLTGDIALLYQLGVLRDDAWEPPPLDASLASGYVLLAYGALERRTRLEHLLATLRERLRPGALVVDIASTTGLLAAAAALAGAKVFAVPAPGAGELVAAGVEASGCRERVRLLPEGGLGALPRGSAELVVSERLLYRADAGYAALREFWGAARDLLADGGRALPGGARIVAQAARAPEALLAQRVYRPETIARWRDWYGIDFSPCAALAAATPHLLYAQAADLAGWQRLSAWADLAAYGPDGLEGERLDIRASITAERAGECNALLIATQLDPQARPGANASEPDAAARLAVWLPPQPLELRAGERLSLRYQEPAATLPLQLAVGREP